MSEIKVELQCLQTFLLIADHEEGLYQEHKTTFFCLLSVQGSRYCLEFSTALGRPKMSV